MRAGKQKNIEHIEQKLFWVLAAVIAASIAVYLYFVVSAAVYAADRQHIASQAAELRSGLSELESTYLAEAKRIDPEFARQRGYHDAQEVVYARRDTLVSNSVYNSDNEI